MSRSIFQFEEDGREFLHFQNTDKLQYEIIIYDIAGQKMSKRVPLKEEGAVSFGSFQNNKTRWRKVGKKVYFPLLS